MEIIFSSFQGLNNNKLRGMARQIYPLTLKLPDSIKYKYFIGEVTNSKLPDNVLCVSNKYILFKKIIFKIVRMIDLPSVNEKYRRWFEVLFDYFMSKHVTSGCTLVYSSYLKRTALKNKKLGGKNIFLSGNPDDQAIYDIVIKDMKSYDIFIRDVYTDIKRVNRINMCMKLADKIIINTQSQLETYSISVPKNKLYFKEYSIEPNFDLFNNLNNSNKETIFTYSYIAHNAWLKGLVHLLEAWESSDINSAQLMIAGSISSQMQRFIKNRFPVLKNVKFVGYVDKPHQFIKKSNVIVIPSLLDAAPVTVIESLACDVPVICSDGCGSKTLINNDNGIIFEAGNIYSLSEKLKEARSKFSKPKSDLLIKTNQQSKFHDFVLSIIL